MQKQYLLILLLLKLSSFSFGQVNAPDGVTVPTAVAASAVNPVPAKYTSTIPQNFLRTWQIKKPGADISQIVSSTNIQDVFQTTDYADGLGRPLQKVERGVTPSGKDMVSPRVYDNLGREVYRYLPYPASTVSDGKIKLNPFADQATFMQGQSQYSGEQVFYSKTVFDNSPLSQVEKSMVAGNSFAGAAKGTEIKYESNVAGEVKIWTIDAAINSVPVAAATTIAIPGYPPRSFPDSYDAASLYRGMTVDPAGKRVVEYKDKEGRLLLKKVEIKQDGEANVAADNGWLCTYYVYDDMSNLRYTITPRAVEWLIGHNWTTMSADILNELCYRYDYDDQGRMIVKKAPGASEEYSVYDKKDRVVFTQDGNMRSLNQWIIVLYDKNDRQFMTGIINYTGDQAALQTYADDHFDASPNPLYPGDLSFSTRETGRENYKATNSIEFLPGFESEQSASFVAEIDAIRTIGQFRYGGVELPPGSNFILLTQKFYDNYNWVSAAGNGLPSSLNNGQLQGGWTNSTAASAYPYPLAVSASSQTMDMVTGTKTRVLVNGQEQYLYSVSFYDDYGNVIQVHSTNQMGGSDVFTTQYGYGGKILASRHQHVKGGVNSQTYNLYSRFVYDAAGRLTNTYKKINGEAEKLTSTNTYNELSQLVKIELGDPTLNNGKPVETLDYTYNLQGSLKGMNEAFVNGASNDRFFGEVLSRDYGFIQPQYNGNIAGVKWRSIGDGEQRAFGFNYDPANRLLKADFTQNNSGWNNSANVDFSMKLGDGANPATAYDANGNIKGMTQKGLKLYQSEELDNLTYNYEFSNYSNKLQSVGETAASSTAATAVENTLGDFKDNAPNGLTYDYEYDLNGNLTKDLNKGIGTATTDGIEYNYLNLPSKVTFIPPSGGGGAISYLYDAAGERLQKVVRPASGSNTTYTYAGPFTYKNDQLQYIYTEDGRIRPTFSQSGVAGWAYDCFIKDHLGNVRMILTDEQRKDIYPTVSFEPGTTPDNPDLYEREDVSIVPKPGNFGTAETNGQQVQLLRKSGQSLGVSKLLKVMVKDKINVTVDYYFPSESLDNSSANGISTLVNTLLPLFDGGNAPAALKGSGSAIPQQLNASEPLNTLLKPENASEPSALPKAYLNILFFDEQMHFVKQNSEIVQVATAGSRQTINEAYIEAPKNGYVYVYVSNESNNLVYFDNFVVSHTRGPVLEENHYYPFGSRMTAICSRALPGVQNNLGYQGKELDEEFDLDWFDFDARYYDPQTGRFLQQDPAGQFASGYTGMGNNWPNNVDPDGRYAFFDDLAAMVIGAVLNVGGNLDNIHSPGDFFKYAGVGALSGEATYYGGPLAGGIVSGAGNALISGSKGWDVVKAGAIGGISAAIGSSIGSAIGGPVAAKLSSVIGSTASGVAATVVSSAVTGGVLGAGSAFISNGNPWQEFLNGMRSGAISGAISAAVPLVTNAINKPKPSVPQEDEPATVKQEATAKTEQANPENGKSYKYSVVADRFEGRTVPDLPTATFDRGSFNADAKGGNAFGLNGGYGVFGEKGLKIGNYRMDLMYSNPSAGKGAGTIFSLKQMKQGGALWRWDYGKLHSTGNMGLHSTIRFQWNGVKYGNTAQRTWYPSTFKAPFFKPLK